MSFSSHKQVLAEGPTEGRPGQIYVVRNVAFIDTIAPTHIDWHGIDSMPSLISLVISFLKQMPTDSISRKPKKTDAVEEKFARILVDVEGSSLPIPRFSYDLIKFVTEIVKDSDQVEKACHDDGSWGCKEFRKQLHHMLGVIRR